MTTGLTPSQTAAVLAALHPDPKQRPFKTATEFANAFVNGSLRPGVPGRGEPQILPIMPKDQFTSDEVTHVIGFVKPRHLDAQRLSNLLYLESIRRDLTPAERDQLTPDKLMLIAIRHPLTDSERAKLSPAQLMIVAINYTLSLADRDRLSPDQLMIFSINNTLVASERKKLSVDQLKRLSIWQEISIEDRRKLSSDQLLRFGISHELTTEEVSRLPASHKRNTR